jgi:hypothetical protein
MSDQSTKFTLEIKGIELPRSKQEEISRALNQALMHKIGELDLMGEKMDAGRNAPLYLTKYLPNGGKLERLFSPGLQSALAKEFHVSAEENFTVSTGLFE